MPEVNMQDLGETLEELREEREEAEIAVDNPQLPPLQIGVNLDPAGRPVVFLTVATPFGSQTYPLDPSIARRVGTQLQDAGSRAASGLSTPAPRPGLILPGR